MNTELKKYHGGLKVECVRKKISNFMLHADFSVQEGERVALVGPSGCGKTSLLRVIAGLGTAPSGGMAVERLAEEGEGGRVFLGAREITTLPPEKREIGFLFQDQALLPSLNVLENAAFGLRMRGVSKLEREREALGWLERVGLKTKARASVQTLSGGERQRVAFVRALVWKPKCLLLDEPFSALDAALRAGLRKELVELHQLWPVPLVMVTHDEADVEAIATRQICFSEEALGAVRRFVG